MKLYTLIKMDLFVEEARKEALRSPMKHRNGAVIINKNKIVSRGFNTYRKNRFPSKCKLKHCSLRGLQIFYSC